ncbi:aldo/keto reductase [Rhizobium laguerreae]|uniref:aldo/keto reductase n=1 Tax=Rhizobium laguerreae TaxID=1076926 RepID=UPI001FE8C0D3|nr:aldo/keto reductase [Rhizobium laguerreae]
MEVATVQNVYNLIVRKHDDVLSCCEQNGTAFIPFLAAASGDLAISKTMAGIAARAGATPTQVALAWLWRKSPAIILIPGTTSIKYLEENAASGDVNCRRRARHRRNERSRRQLHALQGAQLRD